MQQVGTRKSTLLPREKRWPRFPQPSKIPQPRPNCGSWASVAPVKGKSEAELKALARDKLAAALLGCDLGELREALGRRERALTSYGYFEQIVSRRAVPEGVGGVSQSDVPRRKATLRFESQRGCVQRISRINGSEGLTDNDEGPMGHRLPRRRVGGDN